MNHDLNSILGTIRDVGNIYGSFAVTRNGDLVGRDMPAIFDLDALSQASARVLRIYDTFASVDSDIDTCQLRFKEHKLHIRRLDGGYLFVLTPRGVHMPALRMAMNLVAKRLSALNLSALHRLASEPEVIITAAQPVESAPVPEPIPSASGESSGARQAILRPRRRSSQHAAQQQAGKAPPRRSSQQPTAPPPASAQSDPTRRPETGRPGGKRAMVYRGRKITRD
ncbi:MAG: hypothetical protein Tsb0020_18050 [Haliangiales bacterium]